MADLDISGLKPLNTSGLKPIQPQLNTSQLKPLDTSSLEPANTSEIKPTQPQLNTSQLKPMDTSSLKPVQKTGLDVSSLKPHSFMEGAMAPIKDIPREYNKEVQGGMSGMKEGIQDIKSGHPFKGAGKTALGALEYGFSPITAPIQSLVGTPVEKATGSKTAGDTASLAAQMFTPAGIEKGLGSTLSKTLTGAKNIPDNFKGGASAIEKIFSPATASKTSKETEGVIRQERGIAERETAKTKADLDQYQKQINALPPEQKLNFIEHVEGRSQGVELSDKSLQPVADSLKKAFESRKTTLEAMPSFAKASFVEDYFPHLWKDPKKAQDFIAGFGKQGTGKNLKARSIPTIADGLKAGLQPAFDNPLDAAMQYTANMDKYISTNKIFETMKDTGTVRHFAPGEQPSGWMELKGTLANKADPLQKAYAPEDAARVYNNYISRGFAELGPLGGDSFSKAQKLVNSGTMMELGLSAFHASTMAMETMISGAADSVGLLFKGKPLKAGIEFSKSITPLKVGANYMKGKKFEQQYLGLRDHGPDFRKITDLGTKAGMRATGYDRSMHSSAAGSFWDSFKKGTLKAEALSAAKDIKNSPVLGTAKHAISGIARTMETVAQPLFEKLIPRLKNGAFYDTMQKWIETHPASTSDEQLKMAREIWDSMDNRFGELVQDNLFWNKALKQSLQLSLRAMSWDVGTLREIGGGIKDLGKTALKGDELSPRAQYVIALPIVTGLYNSAAQYLKTGKGPEDIRDLYAYQTGGQNPDGTPERAMIPGYMKDVVGYAHDPQEQATGKIATVPKSLYQMMTNQDYAGHAIADPNAPYLKRAEQYLSFFANQFEPISIKNAEKGMKKGSNISGAEQALAIRPAPSYVQNPEKSEYFKHKKGRKDWKTKQKSDVRQQSQYGGPQ